MGERWEKGPKGGKRPKTREKVPKHVQLWSEHVKTREKCPKGAKTRENGL